jgi:hypothetical protein
MSTENQAPQTTASSTQTPQAIPPAAAPKALFMASGNSLREFALNVTKALVAQGGTFQPMSKEKKDSMSWAVYELGTEGTGRYRNEPLGLVESRSLATPLGVPMAIAFRVALLDIVPQAQAEAHRRERQLATAERKERMASALTDNELLAKLNERRIANGEKPIEL